MVQAEAGRLPRPHNEEDAEKLVALAEKANETAKDKAEIDADIVRKVAFTAAGELSPMAATLGGIVGQEVRTFLSSQLSHAKCLEGCCSRELCSTMPAAPVFFEARSVIGMLSLQKAYAYFRLACIPGHQARLQSQDI